MKKYFSVLLAILLVAGFAGLSSCKSRSARQAETEMDMKEKQEVEKLGQQIEKNVYPLPTSAEVIKLLTELEVGYTVGVTNPVENVKKYFSSAPRAINLGVYGADLSYVTLYNMNQEVINYLNAIRSLSYELNMSKIYDESLYDSIKTNFDNRDKLVAVLTDAFNETYAYLADNEQQPLALLVVGGAWVEGMYLTTHVSEVAYNAATFSKVLLEQKASFELFLELTQSYLSDQNVSDFVKKLDPIKKVYEGLTTSLTDKDIANIKQAMLTIRSQIIQ